jgi:hypothetical protein
VPLDPACLLAGKAGLAGHMPARNQKGLLLAVGQQLIYFKKGENPD